MAPEDFVKAYASYVAVLKACNLALENWIGHDIDDAYKEYADHYLEFREANDPLAEMKKRSLERVRATYLIIQRAFLQALKKNQKVEPSQEARIIQQLGATRDEKKFNMQFLGTIRKLEESLYE